MSAPIPSKRVIHILPSDNIGGAEIAAHSLVSGAYGDLLIQKHFLVSGQRRSKNPHDSYGPATSLNHPQAYLTAVRHVSREKPGLLVASLWRSVLVMIICKLLRPSMKTVVFLHNANSAHMIDRVVNYIGMVLANEIWTDSEATQVARCLGQTRAKSRVISFLLERRSAQTRGRVQPQFIFWGRLRTQKNVRRAVQLFRQIRLLDDQAHFTIIGPDGGEEALIRHSINSLGLEDHVTMRGPLDQDEIALAAASSHFYLQTSTHEGMAMSVVEAMQYGLIPVVTAVGEIANYCSDGANSLIIHDDAATVASLRDLLGNPERARLMSESAVDTWRNISFYRDDVVMRSRHILSVTR